MSCFEQLTTIYPLGMVCMDPCPMMNCDGCTAKHGQHVADAIGSVLAQEE
jgi:hypothetical protein